jgi:hypothetical protein
MSTVPCTWVKSDYAGKRRPARGWDEHGRPIRLVDDLGRPLFERVPAKGMVGRDITNMREMSEPRSIEYLRTDGHIVNAITSPASAVPNGGEFTEDRQRKYASKGWIPVGSCPLRETFKGAIGISRGHLISLGKGIGTNDAPCPDGSFGRDLPPCKHMVAEMAARRDRRAAENRAQLAAHADPQQKQTEAVLALASAVANRSIEAAPADDAPKGKR